MVRIEIVADAAVESDIMGALHRRGVAKAYSKIPLVHGEGDSTPKHGNHIWPEENFILIVYCETYEAAEIRAAISEVKSRFPDVGIKIFEMVSS